MDWKIVRAGFIDGITGGSFWRFLKMSLCGLKGHGGLNLITQKTWRCKKCGKVVKI